ncbi:alpha-glucuronidase [Limosilactobacillus rudii]|nr:alpha-glucuronidase [Limosilactobacillus rudii]MCD7135127.1 alpha-glucuronidase [Limosilactobacillus rudii]
MDSAWLNNSKIHEQLKNDVFMLLPNRIEENDVVKKQLYSEIIEWLKLPITFDKENASIVLIEKKNKYTNDESFDIQKKNGQIIIIGNTSKALMYGFYSLIRMKLTGKLKLGIHTPSQSLRMINHWDQTDGSIERGYSGASIFFGNPDKLNNPDKGNFNVKLINGDIFRHDTNRLLYYARMLASIGINSISINNVNVRGQGIELITSKYLNGVQEIADIFRKFGIKLFLSVNWAAPKLIGGLETSNPLDDKVKKFWRNICKNIYLHIPDFGGFVVKADSEGEPGPYQYGCNHAQGANMLADAIKPFGGLIIWRAFVYNSHQDWRNRKTDRAKAAFENFASLDGKFASNVILQMKFGPIDFQTAEPLQPLFGKLRNTNQMMEFEITAEYLGHQIDINYVLPQWCKMINFDTEYEDLPDSKAGAILRETAVDSNNTGMAAVGNIGMSEHWTGNPLAQSNLYGYGRLCWNNRLSAEEILKEWIIQTFPSIKKKSRDEVYSIMITSNETYTDYCAPLGVGFMVVPHYHYGPSVNGYEYDRWGTYHFADRNGVGVDRTMKTGSGFVSMYSKKLANKFENPDTTPMDVMLFFHHLNYDFILPNNKTLIQTIYDLHFRGYRNVKKYVEQWECLKGDIEESIYNTVRICLNKQLENALEWRDQVNTYFYRMSGVKDSLGRKIYS